MSNPATGYDPTGVNLIHVGTGTYTIVSQHEIMPSGPVVPPAYAVSGCVSVDDIPDRPYAFFIGNPNGAHMYMGESGLSVVSKPTQVYTGIHDVDEWGTPQKTWREWWHDIKLRFYKWLFTKHLEYNHGKVC
jgi:hypothetical protein